ncbi:thioredoxin family protein [Hydrogenimonas sp.]
MTLETIRSEIEKNPGLLLYFEGERCNVCHALRPKLFEAFEKSFPKIEKVVVDAEKEADIAANFGVFSVPTAIVFLDGKEFARVSRNVSIPALVEKIRRPYEIMLS